MPGSYTLELELFSLLNATTSDFEIWADGSQFGGGYNVSSTGTTISVVIPYGGALPTSLEFRFNDLAPGSVDQINIRSVRINGRSVNTNNYLSTDTLNDTDSSTVSMVNNSFLFDDSDPAGSTFTTGATQTFDNTNNLYNEYDDPTPQVFDMLGGRDIAYLGNGADTVSGGAGNDKLFGRGGDDLLYGDAGNDKLDGGLGNDTLYGGDGNDRLFGRDGNDQLSGGLGDDALNGNDGDDVIFGGAGNDRLNGSNGADYLFGDADNDILVGGAGNDSLDGGTGDDLAYGGAGIDVIYGGDGADILIGNSGDDTIHGDAGNDTIYGNADVDTIYGGDDNDTIILRNGDFGVSEYLDGGNGIDEILLANATTVDLTTGTVINLETLTGSDGDDDVTYNIDTALGFSTIDLGTGTDNSRVEISGTADVTALGTPIVLNAENGFLTGSAGNDDLTITGTQLNSLVYGSGIINFGGGADIINLTSTSTNLNILGATDASVVGLEEIDASTSAASVTIDLNGQSENFTVTSGVNNDILILGAGDDNIFGDAGNDTIYGGDGNDFIEGFSDDDTLYGEGGNDLITGEFGFDYIDGGTGNDEIYGGRDDDIIIGGVGVDEMYGQDHNDTFYLANGDFAAGEIIDGGLDTDNILLTNATTVDFTTGTITDVENLDGSAGDDDVTYTIQQALGFSSIDLAGGTDNSRVNITGTVDVTALGTPTVLNTENGFLTGSAGNDDLTITGGQLNALVFGSGIINFAAGTDIINLTSTSTDLNTLGATDASILGLEEIDASTSAADVTIDLNGQTENLIVTGGANNDTLTTGAGADTINGGLGIDIIDGGEGADTINGGDGDDTLTGGFHNDTINGGAGNDTIFGGQGTNNSNNGNDIINGDAGDDIIDAGAGNDTVDGGADNDTIDGGGGTDVLNGGTGNDTFLLANNDFGAGESIDGGAGTDELIFTNATTVDFTTGTLANLETLTGSAGNDDVTIEINTLGQFATADLAGGTDVIRTQIDGIYDAVTNGVPTVTNTENGFLVGSGNNDTLTANNTNLSNLIYGTGTIDMGAGNDTINITEESAVLNTLGATDGGVNNLETISAATATVDLTLDMSGQTENLILIGGTGRNTILGGSGDDTITGNTDNDTFTGGAGVDVITADAGNDEFLLANNDFAAGESLDGGAGTDIITLTNATTVDFQTGTLTAIEELDGSGNDDNVTMSATQFVNFTDINLRGGTDILNVFADNSDISALGTPVVAGTETGNLVGDAGNNSITLTGNQLNAILNGSGIINLGAGTDTINLTSQSNDLNTLGTSTDAEVVGVETISALASGANLTIDMEAQTEDFTLIAGTGNNTLRGGSGADTITGNIGDDLLRGNAGADIISAGAGDDRIELNNGDFAAGESIDGGAGTDEIRFQNATTVDFTTGTITDVEEIRGSGNDDDVTYTITQALNFTQIDLRGGTDNSRVLVSGTVDVTTLGTPTVLNTENGFLTGSTGADNLTITGTQLDALVYGSGIIDFSTGTDVIRLTSTSANLNTLGATDASIIGLEQINASTAAAGVTINMGGQTEAFTITGSANADTLTSGSGDDTINAGGGDDVITAGAGLDIITGDAGNDTINLANNDFAAGESIDGGAGTDEIILTNATTVDFTTGIITAVENLTGSGGNDDVTYSITQALNFTTIDLGGGTDNSRVVVSGTVDVTALGTPTVLNTENGFLTGSAGNDDLTITGTQLDALIFGGGIIDFDTGADTLNLTTTSTNFNTFGATDGDITGLETISTTAATADITIDMSGQTEGFTFNGGGFIDTFTSGSGNDTINGGGGNDVIVAGAGNDTVNGDDGDDTITSISGANILYGNLGSDVITGGSGNDTIYAFDNTVHTQGDSINAVNEIIFQENFSSSTGAFSYSDGGFGGTDGANVDVTGSRITNDGAATPNGALEVYVDGQNNSAFTNASGSWDASYTATSNLSNVRLTFSYRHIHDTRNDTGEDSQVWFEFDGVTYNQSGANSFISEAYGAAGTTDTGWVTVTIDLPDLVNGNTYNMSMGILHLGSNRNNEDAEVRFDDVLMTAGTTYGSADATTADADSGSTNTLNGGAGNDILYGSAGINFLNGDAGDDTLYSGTVADEIIFSNDFDSNAEGYTYLEDYFATASTAGYAVGAYDAVDGSGGAGSVAITLGGQDNADIDDMNGAWQLTFNLAEAKNDLVLTFDYHVYDSQTASNDPFDNGEDLELYADIDGTNYSNDANPYFFQLLGSNSYDAYDNGWETISINVGSLSAGNHTLSLGGLLSRKTFQPEEYTIAFDNVSIIDTAILNVNTLSGGDGLDTLYGSSGRDVFLFEAATAYNDLDVIENFGYTLDAIDLSDLLTGYTPGTDDINDFVQLSEAGGNTTIAVDANGTAGGASFSNVAIVNGVTGMDIDVMEVDGTLIF